MCTKKSLQLTGKGSLKTIFSTCITRELTIQGIDALLGVACQQRHVRRKTNTAYSLMQVRVRIQSRCDLRLKELSRRLTQLRLRKGEETYTEQCAPRLCVGRYRLLLEPEPLWTSAAKRSVFQQTYSIEH